MKVDQEKIESLQQIITSSKNMVFFGGAGTSTESNIPDFRSKKQGLFMSANEEELPPEVLLSRSFFEKKPEVFFRYYKTNLVYPDATPNDTHFALVKLEKSGKLKAIVTQNIDGLHQKAGSKKVLELHGSIYRNYCVECKDTYPIERLLHEEGVPYCDDCNGIIRPDVTLYQEPLKNTVVENAIKAIMAAETLIIGGTSLVVYPAAGFIEYFGGKHLVIINKDPTLFDQKADLVIKGSIGEVFRRLQL